MVYNPVQMRKRSLLRISFLALVFTACATSVPFQAMRPPTWNTLGIKRLAVMPFTTSQNSAHQRSAATWLTNESLERIQAADHFTLVNSAEVTRIQSANGNIENITDALFSGQVLSLSVNDSTSQAQRKNKDETVTTYTLYHREVKMSFSYNLTRAGRGSDMIGSETKRDLTLSSTDENRNNVRSAEAMIQELVRRNMSGISRYLVPYAVTENRKLEKETSKDKFIKQLTKEAETLVKAGNYKAAQEAYLGIYRLTGSFAAGYNAGLLIELQGDMEGAVAFMQRVHNETGNPKAALAVERLYRAKSDAGLVEAYAENMTQRDRVIARMVDTLPYRMPANPRVALVNNSRNERDLVEVVINGITDGFLSRNITVVDRRSRALIEMERNYQLSGNVSDDEMVSIGHEAGVNAFILVTITGSGAERRLSVRMLDVERNTILYQSPQSDEMNL